MTRNDAERLTGANPRPSLTRRISLVTATAIVVADMIGIGIFTSLGFQVKDIQSGFVLLLLWAVGGGIALCGAIAYAELAAMFPRGGGEYNYLTRTLHPALGFMAGWLSATVGFAAPVALAAMALGEYAKAVVPTIAPLPLALAVIWIVTGVKLGGLRLASGFQLTWTIIKVAMIVAFIIAGFALGSPQPLSFAPSNADFARVASAPFAIALVFVMYSYSGWNAATYIAGDIVDPRRNLPRALVIGTLIVAALYIALNGVFLYTTPIASLAGQIDVAIVAGNAIFGPVGARIVGALICLGLVSSISAMMWIGPYVTMTMGEDTPLLRIFARRAANGAPQFAILLQAAAATVMLATQSFESVLDFIQFSLLLSSSLTVIGMMRWRLVAPDHPRPYRAWGYPVTPLVFLAMTGFMMFYLLRERTTQSLSGLLVMASGLLAYGWLSRQASSSRSERTASERSE